MSNQEGQFDELIRQKFAEKEFIFNEENWEKMENKIASERKIGRITLWSSIFSIGLISGIAISYLLMNTFSTDSNTIANNTSTVEEHSIAPSSNTPTATPVTSQNNVANTSPANEAVISETPEAENKTINSSTTSVIPTEKVKAEKTKNTAVVPQKSNTISSTPKTVATSKKSASTNLIAETKKEAFTETTEQKQVKSEANTNTSAIITTPAPELKKETSTTETTKSVVGEPKQTETLPTINETAKQVVVTEETNTVETTLNNTTTPVDSSLAVSQNSPTTEANIDTLVTEKDLAQSEKPSTSDDFRKGEGAIPSAASAMSLSAATFVTADIGTHYTMGWNYANVNEGRGFNAIAGIGIHHYFNPKWGVVTGLQYGSISNLKATKKTFSNKEYGFGSTSVDTIINTKYLHYLVVPLMLEYNLNNKNAVLFGGNVSYLINTNSSITVTSTAVGPAPAHFDVTDNKVVNKSVNGYHNGAFNKMDAALAIGYRRRLNEKFSIAAIANIGLMDVKKNAFFGVDKTERNSGIKFIITYNLFNLRK